MSAPVTDTVFKAYLAISIFSFEEHSSCSLLAGQIELKKIFDPPGL